MMTPVALMTGRSSARRRRASSSFAIASISVCDGTACDLRARLRAAATTVRTASTTTACGSPSGATSRTSASTCGRLRRGSRAVTSSGYAPRDSVDPDVVDAAIRNAVGHAAHEGVLLRRFDQVEVAPETHRSQVRLELVARGEDRVVVVEPDLDVLEAASPQP